MKWFRWFNEQRQEEQKKRQEARAKVEKEELEQDRRLRVNAKKQLLPIEWLLGVNLWKVDYHTSTLVLAGEGKNNTRVTCWFHDVSGELGMIAVGSVWEKLQDDCMYWVETMKCDIWETADPEQRKHQKMMARVLFCLGTDNPDVLTQFDPAFSPHEKLELRLSMPREFWPQKWLDEDGGNY